MHRADPPAEHAEAAAMRARERVRTLEAELAELRALARPESGATVLPTLRGAVDGLLGRHQKRQGQWFPWPGTPAELPDDAPKCRIGRGDLLPPASGYVGPAWTGLWKKVGPLGPDQLIVLVGATGRGKSALAVQLAESAARAGAPVLYVSVEMGTDEIVARLIALRADERGSDDWGIAWSSILRGGVDRDELGEACSALTAACPNLYVWAPRGQERTVAHLLAMADAVSQSVGGRAPLIVVDYVQRLAAGDELRSAVRDLSGALRDLSRPDGVREGWPGAAVLALSTTSRSNYEHFESAAALGGALRGNAGDGRKSGPVSLESVGKESGELEADASLLLAMTTDRGGGTGAPRPGALAVVKNRYGSTGLISLSFQPTCGRFSEAAPAQSPAATAGQREVFAKKPRRGRS